MEIEITKTQEIINNIPQEEKYKLTIKRHYNNCGYSSERYESLFWNWTLEDVCKLRDRLNKEFTS